MRRRLHIHVRFLRTSQDLVYMLPIRFVQPIHHTLLRHLRTSIMHSFIFSTTVLTIFFLAIAITSAAPLPQSDPPAFIVDPDELTGGGSIQIPDRVVKFVGEDVVGSVGIYIPVVGERDSRRHAEERSDGAETWYARTLGRRTLVDDALKAAAPLTQAVGAKLLPAVEATVQTVSPPAADVVAEAASTVEGALDLVL